MLATWSQEDVRSYLSQIAPDTAADTIIRLEKFTPGGVAVAYHERYEMSRIEELVDEHWGEGTFKQKLGEGKLDDVEYYETWANVNGRDRLRRIYPYSTAHPEAMRAEVDLLQKLARGMGYEFSKVGLYIAKPNTMDEFGKSARTLTNIYEMTRSGNLLKYGEDEHPDYPSQLPSEVEAEIMRIEEFFIANGNLADYEIRPSEIVARNGFA